MTPVYCYCLESTIAGVLPQLRKGRSCPKCKPYACNSMRHPINMTKAVRERLRAAPYYRLGKKHTRYLARKVLEARTAYLRLEWAHQDALEAIGTASRAGES